MIDIHPIHAIIICSWLFEHFVISKLIVMKFVFKILIVEIYIEHFELSNFHYLCQNCNLLRNSSSYENDKTKWSTMRPRTVDSESIQAKDYNLV